MSDSEWTSKMEGSWSSDHEPTDFEILVKVAEATSASIVSVTVVQSQGPMDPKGGSFVNLAKELSKIPVKEVLGDPKRNFLLWLKSTIREPDLERLRKKFRIFSKFELEVSLDTDRACNPPPNWLALYRKFFLAGLSYPWSFFLLSSLKL